MSMDTGEIFFVNVRNDQGARYEVDPERPGGSQSYTDVWSLVRLSGFKTCEIGDVDYDSCSTYIFFPCNGNTDAAFNRPHRCKLIHWKLERNYEVKAYADVTWCSDRFLALMTGSPKCFYVPLGGHPGFGGKPLYPKMWDFCHLSYAFGEREHRMNLTAENGFTIAPCTFNLEERDIILAHSRWGLALHQTPEPIIEPPRYILFASWRLPIVAEACADPFPYKTIPWSPDCKALMAADEGYIRDIVEDNYYLMTTRYSFRNCVEKAVEAGKEVNWL